jgi:hypothetical protein
MLRGIRHEFQRWTKQSAAADTAVLACENGWYVGERRVLREHVRLTVHKLAAAGRKIDVELRLTPTDEPVTLWGAAGKSYGGMSLRFAPRADTIVTTASGRQATDLNLTPLGWADLSGRFANSKTASGVTLRLAPDHPDYPPLWITRQYGFLGVGWPGDKPATLQPGQSTTLRYELLIHRGGLDSPPASED